MLLFVYEIIEKREEFITRENNSSVAFNSVPPSMAGLLAFEAAARHASFAGAAEELGRTPSAVSHAIRELEARLSETLFKRVGRSVKLTQAGSQYLGSVQSALQILQTATLTLQRKPDEHVVRVSALPFFTSTVLLPNLSQFEADNPDLELRIETSSTYADIQNGEADIAIRFGRERSEDLMCQPLISVTGQPVASPDYLAASTPIETIEDLQSHTLIHVRANRDAWRNWAKLQGFDVLEGQKALTFDTILGALDAVKAGLGVALSMWPLIRAYPGFDQTFVPVLTPDQSGGADYNFLCRRSRFKDRKIQKTLDWLKTSIKSQVE